MARARPAEKTAEPEVPLYDPEQHTDPDQDVYLQLCCACGAIRRQRDPVSIVTPVLAEWWAAHGGDGHGPASKAGAVDARETRRQAALAAIGEQARYARGEYPHLDDTSDTALPWPQLPTEG